MGIEVNLDALEDYLSKLEKKFAQDTINNILKEGAKPILKALDKNVPVDTSELKGTLGIINIKGTKLDTKINLGSTSKDRKIIERAYYQEYGNINMVGTKWIKKSYIESKDEAVETIKNEIGAIINDK